MGFDRRTIRIILIVTIVVITTAIILGVTLGKLSTKNGIQLEFIPQHESGSNLIYYNSYDRESREKMVKIIDKTLEEYRVQSNTGEPITNRVVCSETSGPLGDKQVCDVPVNDFHPCTASNQYNYQRSAPCVFLRLNKMVNWTPQPYNNSRDLPADMPEDLKQHINVMSDKPYANMVWVTCDGEDWADVENIGPVQYLPQRGLPSFYFPYNNQPGYLSPLVAVLFERPMIGVLIKVKCKAWARNIVSNKDEEQGSVVFNLMLD